MLYLLGDIHGQTKYILPAIQADLKAHPELADEPIDLVFLGDLQVSESFEALIKELLDADMGVWLIHGNHDSDQPVYWNNLKDSQHRNLDGKVVEIQGLRIAGLGGIFRGEIWNPKDSKKPEDYGAGFRSYEAYVEHLKTITPPRLHANMQNHGRMLKHKTSIFPNEYDTLATKQADILVVHEAPSCHPNGFEALDYLAQSMRVQTVFHGHHHDNIDYSSRFLDMGFKTFGVGLRGITDQTGRVVLLGELDAQRSEHRQAVEVTDK